MTTCHTCPPALPAIPHTPAAQAAYMEHIAAVLDARRGRPWPSEARPLGDVPATLIADICRAVAVIGQSVARADEAYIRGLADGARARRVAGETAAPVLKLSMRGRRWRVGQDSGDTFEDDDDFDGLTLTIELRSEQEAREVAMVMMSPQETQP